MNFLLVTSDLQTLELAYALAPNVSEQHLSFRDCTDISLGLIETNGLNAVLSAKASLMSLEETVVTLQKIELNHVDDKNISVRLEPLQQMNFRFEKSRAIIDEIPLMLPEDTPYYSLVQHLIMGRLEVVLTGMDVFYLGINAAVILERFAALLKLRSFKYSHTMYNKYLLMTNTVNVLP